MNFFELLKAGGMSVYPLVICSIIMWAIVFERWWFLHQFEKQFYKLWKQTSQLLQDKKISEALGASMSYHPLLSSPFASLFDEDRKTHKNLWHDRVARRLGESHHGLKRSLWILATIGTTAPFIGLFGTVVGIVRSFDAMAKSGKSGFSVVAAGLSEALISTAIGILVAVIAVLFYNYFQSRLQNIHLNLKSKLEDLIDQLEKV